VAERQAIVRQIMQRVRVAGEGRSERLQLTIAWVGGGTTAGVPMRPLSRIAHLSAYPLLCERLQTFAQQGYRTTRITAGLAQEGCHAPKYARPFSRQSVIALMRRLGVQQPRRRRRPPLNAHEWWVADCGREVGCANSTLHPWRKRGGFQAHRPEQNKRGVAWVDEAERTRLNERCALPAGYESRQMWLDAHPSHPTPSPR
jgi:hypothetical protein